jgi:hypothetical protein
VFIRRFCDIISASRSGYLEREFDKKRRSLQFQDQAVLSWVMGYKLLHLFEVSPIHIFGFIARTRCFDKMRGGHLGF